MTSGSEVVAAIEAGGTKFVCALGRTPEEIRTGPKHVIATTDPQQTMTAVAGWLHDAHGLGRPAAVGVASFGPLNLDRGCIGPTPKPGWAGFDWRGALAHHLPGAAVGIDTDTNGAALAEATWGAARGLDVSVYVTVGTGIGGGVVIKGAPLHGLVHPEIGHMRIPHDPEDPFPGICPFHRDCLEGMASGPAVQARWGTRGADLDPEHPAWDLESRYLASAMMNLALTLSPQAIIVGGGVMAVPGLLDSLRSRTRDLLAGYVDSELLGAHIDRFLLPPGLGPDSGVLGAFALGRRVLGL